MSEPAVRVLYVLKRFPQLSQTFVVRELVELERLGVITGIDALGPSSSGLRHRDVDAVRAPVRVLPRRPAWTTSGVAGAHLRLAIRRPVTWLRAWRRSRHHDRRRFLQAGLVAERARREGYQHLHAHFASAAAEVARDAAALAGITYSVTAHAKDIFHHDHVPHVARRLGAAAAVVTVSEFNVVDLTARLPGTPVVHIPNGIPRAEPRPESLDGPVLCVGRLVEKKGVDTLLRAVAELRDVLPELRLEIVGDGDLRSELTALADRLGLADRCRFVGALDSEGVAAAMDRCSMLALPCRIGADGDRDGLPTVLGEAMARGVPVISTDLVGIPELVRDGDTGVLVPPDDPVALAAAIEKLWRDATWATRLGAAGREHVRRALDPERSAVALATVFGAAIAGAAR